jgi:hypothetical protein
MTEGTAMSDILMAHERIICRDAFAFVLLAMALWEIVRPNHLPYIQPPGIS